MASKQTQKEPFRFEYTRPTLDWYDIVKVEIQPHDYALFRLELRYGNTWWLVGMNPPKSDYKPSYLWDETDVGRMGVSDIIRFTEWAECGCLRNGSKLCEIKAISSSLNVVSEFAEIVKVMEKKDGS